MTKLETPTTNKSVQYEILQHNVILLRDVLTIPQQVQLWKCIQESSRHYKETRARNAKSNFIKVLSFSTDAKKWKNKIPSMFYDITDIAVLLLFKETIASSVSKFVPNSMHPTYITSFKYPVKGGTLTEHVDVKSNWVVLYSLGNSANFTVKSPQMQQKKAFSFNSGDVLVFDASEKAKIKHGITHIIEDTVPSALVDCCPELKEWRVSIQFRVFGELKPSKTTSGSE
ncbi:hypothetical protein RFI_22839 [Reticulomyxa filosa]|uniref:Alpha-ketoglutarate-dependent dioxygenase AlkB-like domain-containing protein n=1 Tax=Reticulomyxa filosa TaxID=46433 RepID=X6ML03_RETFI|nr:hypothetical protein RFI_22839 [Reticulomyxa filosa]|eukprot:ETO14529.1 hypothetical protein RFI_22839 [Reticulomyxa filosa]